MEILGMTAVLAMCMFLFMLGILTKTYNLFSTILFKGIPILSGLIVLACMFASL